MTRFERFQGLTVDEAAEIVSEHDKTGYPSGLARKLQLDYEYYCCKECCEKFDECENGEFFGEHYHSAAVNWLHEEVEE